MKKNYLFFVLFVLLFGFVFSQNENNQLIDEMNKELNEINFKFKEVNSCEEFKILLSGYLDKYRVPSQPIYYADDLAKSVDMEEGIEMAEKIPEVGGGGKENYSITNIQKIGVSEPEIIKSNGKNLFYYNNEKNKIFLIKTPLDGNEINLDDSEIVSYINIPNNVFDLKLFLYENKLVIIGKRDLLSRVYKHQYLGYASRSFFAVYDISNPSVPNLERYSDLDGGFYDTRMIDGKLYILTEINLNRYGMNLIDELFERDSVLPKAIDITEDDLNISKLDCEKIKYILPTQEVIEKTNISPSFNLVYSFDLSEIDSDTNITLLWGPRSSIHVSEDSMYFVQRIWLNQQYKCPFGIRCIETMLIVGGYSLVHKFDINGLDLNYKNTNIIKGYPIDQYSMDEDNKGNFRIITRGNWAEGTNLFIFDENLDIQGKISGIAPMEQFESSRFMGDKLYLVTFERKDPLFVVDLENVKNPKIIGELEIPGYSRYLHPIKKYNNEQYLLGLGYYVDGAGSQSGVQVSLFKVDYDKKEDSESKCGWLKDFNEKDYNYCLGKVDEEKIYVAMLDNMVFGGRGSIMESMNNPRMFVMDYINDYIVLPMVLKNKILKGQNCNIIKDKDGNIIDENCYDKYENVLDFIGYKKIGIDIENGKLNELYSQNYYNTYNSKYGIKNYFYNNNIRVGYLENILYYVGHKFLDFINPDTDENKLIEYK